MTPLLRLRSRLSAVLLAALAAGAGQAQDAQTAPTGDPAAGEAAFGQCGICHSVRAPDGSLLAGRGAKTGPNLYGVAGRAAGGDAGFRYSKPLTEAAEAGLVWDEAQFAAFTADPSGTLSVVLDERVRSRMGYQIRNPEDAIDIYAYLASLTAD